MDKHGIARKLIQLKEQLEEKKAERSEFQGEYKSLVSRLKTEFSIGEVGSIEARLKDLDTDLEALDESMADIIQEVEAILEDIEE